MFQPVVVASHKFRNTLFKRYKMIKVLKSQINIDNLRYTFSIENSIR